MQKARAAIAHDRARGLGRIMFQNDSVFGPEEPDRPWRQTAEHDPGSSPATGSPERGHAGIRIAPCATWRVCSAGIA